MGGYGIPEITFSRVYTTHPPSALPKPTDWMKVTEAQK